jgi:hypothetical protein
MSRMTEAMEIRDHFAAAALQALVAGVVIKPGGRIDMEGNWENLAITAFCLADCMMEWREF